MTTIQLDIVSDVVCPWCYIGKRRIEETMALRPEITFNLTWRPYQLNPDMPMEGMNHKEYYANKFGPDRVKGLVDNMTAAGKTVGLDFNFAAIEKSPNTLNAHRLLRWAINSGNQHEVQESLFKAYFIEGKDVGDSEVLTALAVDHGLDAKIIGDLLKSDRDVPQVKAEIDLAREMGVSGVPCFIFDQKMAVSGAQEPAQMIQVIDRILELRGEAQSG